MNRGEPVCSDGGDSRRAIGESSSGIFMGKPVNRGYSRTMTWEFGTYR